jgi:hypothetical protein
LLTTDQFIKGKIVEISWRFGSSYSGGHLAGQMVMNVLANRFRCGWGSYLSILENVPNFMAENEIPSFKLTSAWEPSFTKLLHAIEGCYAGSTQDLTKGALYFGDLNNIQRAWFKTKIIDANNPDTGLRQHPIVANMNSLSFFK